MTAQAVWEQLEHWLEILPVLDDGSKPWHEVFAEADLPPGPCKQTAAIELAEALCTDLRRELLAAGAS